MHISSSSVLTWSHRALAGAVETGFRLMAHVAAISGCGSRPADQRGAEAPRLVVSSGVPQQPPGTLPRPVVGPARGTGTASEAQGQRPIPARAATASVTPAMVRRWAHEQGIDCRSGADPQSLMEQYLA